MGWVKRHKQWGEKWSRHPVFYPAQGGLQKVMLYQSIFPYPPLACSKSDDHYIKIGITLACDRPSCSLIPGLATVGAPTYACFARRFWPEPWLEVRSKHCCLRLVLGIGNLTWKLDCNLMAESCNFQPGLIGRKNCYCFWDFILSVLSLILLKRSFSTNL